jgi:hypothetical protein
VLPGTAPRPDWPGRAEAAVGLPGTGLLGTHGGSAPVPIASLAKIMTAYLVLSGHPLPAGASGPMITVTAADAVAAYASDRRQGRRGSQIGPVIHCQPCAPSHTGRTRKAPDTPHRTPGSGPRSGHDAARVFGVLDQVQHPEQQDCRRLPEIEHLRRPAQNHPGITQVSLEVIGRALRGALEQRLCGQGFLSRR